MWHDSFLAIIHFRKIEEKKSKDQGGGLNGVHNLCKYYVYQNFESILGN